jgi:hypothetical protein
MKDLYYVATASCVEDVENGCLRPSDGGMYCKHIALLKLENGNGGTMTEVQSGRGFMVSHIKEKNDWLRKLLKIK